MNQITTTRTVTADELSSTLTTFHPSIQFHKALDILSPVPLRDDYLQSECVDLYDDEAVKCALSDYVDILNSRLRLIDHYTNFVAWMTAYGEWMGLTLVTYVTTKDVEGCDLPFLEIQYLALSGTTVFRSGGIAFHPDGDLSGTTVFRSGGIAFHPDGDTGTWSFNT